MISELFQYVEIIEDIAWGYIGFPLILFLGLYFSYRLNWFQIRYIPQICRYFYRSITTQPSHNTEGVSHSTISPIRAFFASVGGSFGIGNVVAITTAVQIGGPGALLWIWATAILGSIIKYSEVCIGMKTRKTVDGQVYGGPMHFLQQASAKKWMIALFCIFMGMYGVEIYQFGVIVDIATETLEVNRLFLVFLLISMVIYAEQGGIKRVSAIASKLVPFFLTVYLLMGLYVLCAHFYKIPYIIKDIALHAFQPKAMEGAFIGSTILLTISQGVRRICYSSDLGVGYASIIHSQSDEKIPERQATLLIFEVFIDTFIVCTISIMLILLTGVWKENIPSTQLVQKALGTCFPYTEYFMPLLLFLLGYNTITTYFSAGMKTMQYLMPRYGRNIYYIYAISAFTLFSFFNPSTAISVIACAQFGLLVLNSFGIWRLRKLISFDENAILDKNLYHKEKEEQVNYPQLLENA